MGFSDPVWRIKPGGRIETFKYSKPVGCGRDFMGKHKESANSYPLNLEEADLKRERAKARELRESQWWKRRLARGRCHYCGRSVSPRELTMDHIVPVSRGGKTTKGNVAACCKSCNTAKKQLLPIEWEEFLKNLNRPAP